MSKKQKAPKGAVVWRQTAEQATLAKKPRYNGFACGHGVHGGTKYNRQKAKRALERQLKQEGAPRGSFLLCCDVVPRGVSGDVRFGTSAAASRQQPCLRCAKANVP